MCTLASLNGKRLPLASATVPVLDRGFLFGDGVYEVARIYGGRPFLFEEHMSRLGRSLDELRIQGVDLLRVRNEALSLIGEAGVKEATLYLQITRGAQPVRTHAFPAPGSTLPTELMYVLPFQDKNASLRRMGGRAITFPEVRWGRCDVKSVNLLGNVLAAQAAKEADATEAIFVTSDGILTEGAHTSLFGVVGGKLRTMPLSNRILPGVTRDLILRLARQMGLVIDECALTLAELSQTDELFLTGTTTEVMPIVQLDSHTIGNGAPGPLTTKLQRAYDECVENFRRM